MNASKAISATLAQGNLPRAFSPRRRRLHFRPNLATPVQVTENHDSSPVSLLSLGLVAAVALLLSLLACSFIVTGLAVWVANGAAEWVAAAVPALLAILLFAFAWRMAGLLQWRGR
ncbi:hypothetical protein DFR29_112139 [Tahibacter aquaticus]|uniref:Uncharacterized protein n=1 Tax=Tahibacter aquaticus TaxID=520092 RepID=A0A4R6YRS8_9GAMM|nr:hypothetical protein DFR29_112139 [Tahibacter aquaticus]